MKITFGPTLVLSILIFGEILCMISGSSPVNLSLKKADEPGGPCHTPIIGPC